jgi:hypothetical protein
MSHQSQPSVAVDFDVAAVITEASAFAGMIVAGDIQGAARSLSSGSVADVSSIVELLPHPLSGSEVVSLTVPDSGRSTTLTRYTGAGDPVLVLAVWIETDDRLAIRDQRVAGV